MYVKANPVTGFYEQVPVADSMGATQPFSLFKLHFQGVTGALGATYRLNEQISFKANVARGYRSPNITEIASNGLDPGAHIYYEGNLDFKPEFNVQEDIGVTGTFSNVSFSFSAFDNFIQNYIYEDQKVSDNGNPVVIVPGNKTFQYQQTNAMLWGMNATMNVRPVFWKAFHFDNIFSIVYGYNLNPRYRGAGVYGEYLPFIPPPHWLSRITYDIPVKNRVISIVTLKAETDYNAAQNRYLGLYNTETATAAYALLNGAVSTEIKYAKNKAMQFQVAINNIFNTAYQSHLSRLQYFEYYPQSPNGHLGIYNMGRNICFKLILPF